MTLHVFRSRVAFSACPSHYLVTLFSPSNKFSAVLSCFVFLRSLRFPQSVLVSLFSSFGRKILRACFNSKHFFLLPSSMSNYRCKTSLFSAINTVLSAYLKLFTFCPPILIPLYTSSLDFALLFHRRKGKGLGKVHIPV